MLPTLLPGHDGALSAHPSSALHDEKSDAAILRRIVFGAVVASTASSAHSTDDGAIAADAAALLGDVCSHFVAAFRGARREQRWSDGIASPMLLFAILMSAVAHECSQVDLAARVGARAAVAVLSTLAELGVGNAGLGAGDERDLGDATVRALRSARSGAAVAGRARLTRLIERLTQTWSAVWCATHIDELLHILFQTVEDEPAAESGSAISRYGVAQLDALFLSSAAAATALLERACGAAAVADMDAGEKGGDRDAFFYIPLHFTRILLTV